MGRVKIKFPSENPLFTCSIPVRISDINYGNHLANDAILSIMHEVRMQWLRQWEYDELHVADNALIMADVMIAYKSEAFYGDVLDIRLYVSEITTRSFDLLYEINIKRNHQIVQVAHAKTGMVCFDYKTKKICNMTEALKSILQRL